MDTRTGLVIATLMMLLNGGVLGLMHKNLSADVQPSAADWRIGTLLFASGTILLSVQDMMPLGLVLPLANGFLMVGVVLYWRATRRFVGLPDTRWLFAPIPLAVLGIYWFAAQVPDQAARVYFATVVWVLGLFAAAWTLRGSPPHQDLRSRKVLASTFAIVGGFMLLRSISFILQPDQYITMLESRNVFNLMAPLVVTVLPVIGTTAFLVMCSERIRNQWQHAAATDYLTELPNRRTITGSGVACFNHASRNGSGLAVAVIDIDHFKQVNDRLGHDAGDVALKHVATALAHHCRGPHMVGRQGGEEFVALLVVSNAVEAQAAAERLRLAVESSPLQLNAQTIPLTISVGVAVYRADDTSYDSLLRRADHAVYAAKAGGRNQVAMAPDMAQPSP
ncbi:MAG: GGDEF domain-containing protein [Rhodoferax sp.]